MLQEWNGTHFTSSSLQSLGLVYQLGHSGHSCTSPDPKLRNMTVLDVNGIHSVTFQYCACETSHRTSNIRQLMRTRWYPATTTDPRSCATFQVLDLYRLLNVRANVNANDFISTLVALTDALGFLEPPVCVTYPTESPISDHPLVSRIAMLRSLGWHDSGRCFIASNDQALA